MHGPARPASPPGPLAQPATPDARGLTELWTSGLGCLSAPGEEQRSSEVVAAVAARVASVASLQVCKVHRWKVSHNFYREHSLGTTLSATPRSGFTA